MNSIKSQISKIVLSAVAIAVWAGIIYGMGYGINQLGGFFFRDESVFCRKEKLNDLAVTADGKTLITGGKQIRIWDIATRQKLYDSATVRNTAEKIVGLAPAAIDALTIAPDGRTFISATSSPGAIENQGTHEIQIWDLASRQPIRTLKEHWARVRFLAVSPDSQTLIGQDFRGVILFWNLATGQVKKVLHAQGQQRFSMPVSPDGKVFASTDGDGTITLWDMATGNAVGKLKADPSHTPLAISAGNRTLLIQNAGDVKRFRDIATGAELQTIKGSYIESDFAVSPDGKQVLIATDAGIQLYNMTSGAPLQTLNTNKFDLGSSISIVPDGSSFITNIKGKDTLWDLATGAKIHQFEGSLGWGTRAFAAGQILVVGDRNGNDITLWDLRTGKRIYKFCNQ
ncbi:MAG: WD40 repeat domain-containing protein [Oscillatoriaceae cyanobacterium Prado104]|jgi:WD40 repeat protein|nr:WD40 repeat domain-containing protein [Oscillatoriaceae cyanobacterium Prado104]